MPLLVDFARSLALTFYRLPPEERSQKIQSYLLVGAPGRGAVPMTAEAALVLRNYERLRAGATGAALLCRKELPRRREKGDAPQDKAARQRRSCVMLKAWQRRKASS
jgi:hypothetical protein